MPFNQPGSTTAVVSGRFWTTFGCQTLHVLKICCRDRALYARNAIFTCNFRMQHAFLLAQHACAFIEHIQAFDLTEVNESEIYVQQLAMEIIKLIRTHTWRVVYCLYTRVWSKVVFPTSKRRLCVSPISSPLCYTRSGHAKWITTGRDSAVSGISEGVVHLHCTVKSQKNNKIWKKKKKKIYN